MSTDFGRAGHTSSCWSRPGGSVRRDTPIRRKHTKLRVWSRRGFSRSPARGAGTRDDHEPAVVPVPPPTMLTLISGFHHVVAMAA